MLGSYRFSSITEMGSVFERPGAVALQEHRPAFLNVSEGQDVITAHLTAIEQMEEITLHNRAVLQVLERHVVNITCDDPGLKLTSQVIRPHAARAHRVCSSCSS